MLAPQHISQPATSCSEQLQCFTCLLQLPDRNGKEKEEMQQRRPITHRDHSRKEQQPQQWEQLNAVREGAVVQCCSAAISQTYSSSLLAAGSICACVHGGRLGS